MQAPANCSELAAPSADLETRQSPRCAQPDRLRSSRVRLATTQPLTDQHNIAKGVSQTALKKALVGTSMSGRGWNATCFVSQLCIAATQQVARESGTKWCHPKTKGAQEDPNERRNKMMITTRRSRHKNRNSALATLFLASWLVLGCGGDDVSAICEDNEVTVTIVDNHPNGPHVLVIPIGDIADGVEVTYDIQGNNTGHGHFVTVSADDFAALEAGELVTLTSSDTGAVGMDHTHPVLLTCDP